MNDTTRFNPVMQGSKHAVVKTGSDITWIYYRILTTHLRVRQVQEALNVSIARQLPLRFQILRNLNNSNSVTQAVHLLSLCTLCLKKKCSNNCARAIRLVRSLIMHVAMCVFYRRQFLYTWRWKESCTLISWKTFGTMTVKIQASGCRFLLKRFRVKGLTASWHVCIGGWKERNETQ